MRQDFRHDQSRVAMRESRGGRLVSYRHHGSTCIEVEQPNLTTHHEIEELRRELGELVRLADPPNVVLDLEQVEWVSSELLGVLIASGEQLRRRGGQLKLAGVSKAIAGMLSASKLHKRLPAYPTVNEAAGSFSRGWWPFGR